MGYAHLTSQTAKLSFLLMIHYHHYKTQLFSVHKAMISSSSPGVYWIVYSYTKCPQTFNLLLTNFLLSASV